MTENAHLREAEEIELAALAALHAAADTGMRQALGLALDRVGDAVVSIASALPDSAITINRALGLGRTRKPRAADVAAVIDSYRAASVRRFFLQPWPDADPAQLAPLCTSAGLERARAWQKFERGRTEPLPAIDTEFTIRKASGADGQAFARIVCDAFDLGEAAVPWLAKLPEADGWHAYLAIRGDTPAGAGALYVSGEAAYTDFGATAPAFRGRGAQSANLAFRVQAALDMGCARIHTCTGVAVAGDPQHSYANILKCGFSEAYVRDAWQPNRE